MIKGVEVVMANPGRDASTEMNLCWHAPVEQCMLFYWADGGEAVELPTRGQQSAAEDYYDQKASELYNHRVSLKDLNPNTQYYYSIGIAGERYEGYGFRTAPKEADFSIGWLADLHLDPKEPVKVDNVDSLVEYMERETGRELGFLAFSGDLVKFGNMFSNWAEFKRSQAFKRYAIAYLTGNKEYYKLISEEPLKKIKCYTGEWFRDNSNLPDNGPEGTEGSYYFLYGRVLFVAINSCQESSETNKEPVDTQDIIKRQQDWFRRIATQEKGRYDYIITQTHYAYFDNEEPGGGECRWGRYKYWNEIFDEYGVDLALSGDYHEYIRSERLYADEPVADEEGRQDRGTVYITYTMIPEPMIPLNLVESDNPRIARRSIRSSVTAGLIEVGAEGLTFKLLDYEGKVADSTYIPRKRR